MASDTITTESLYGEDAINLLDSALDGAVLSVKLHPVKLTLIFDDKPNIHYDSYMFDSENDEERDRLKEQLDKYRDWDYTPFPGVKKVRGFSRSTGNCDNRGGGCGYCRFKVEDFVYEIDRGEEDVTFRDFVEIVYRLKGSKYDWNYEIYSKIRLESGSLDSVVFEVMFGYGS